MLRLCLVGLLVMMVAVMVGCGDGPGNAVNTDRSGTWEGDIIDADGNTLAHVIINVGPGNTITGGTIETPDGDFNLAAGGLFNNSQLNFNIEGVGGFTGQGYGFNSDGDNVDGRGIFTPPGGGAPVNVRFDFNKHNPLLGATQA